MNAPNNLSNSVHYDRLILGTPSKPLTLLVTGFGGFPGAAKNPTALLIKRLERHRSRLGRQGISLELAILPVAYADLPIKLAALHDNLKPNAILHFGLASRRQSISLETRAKNRLSILHADASGQYAQHWYVVSKGAAQRPARFPLHALKAGFLRAKVKARLSNDAGDYICNQAFYLSLRSPAPLAAFIHVPKRGRLPLNELERAALAAIHLALKTIQTHYTPFTG